MPRALTDSRRVESRLRRGQGDAHPRRIAWALAHRSQLEENWAHARADEPLERIPR